MQSMKSLVLAVISLLLFGCGNYDELKVDLQTEYDRINESGNRAVCYYVGNVQFPYIELPIMEEDGEYILFNKEELMIHLPLFTNLGLLERKIISTEPLLYHYDLTDEGRRYQYTYDRKYDSGRVKYENYFCFGRLVLQEITDYDGAITCLFRLSGQCSS